MNIRTIFVMAASLTVTACAYDAACAPVNCDSTRTQVPLRLLQGVPGTELIDSLGTPASVFNDGQQGETWIFQLDSRRLGYLRDHGAVVGLTVSPAPTGASRDEHEASLVVRMDEQQRVRHVSYFDRGLGDGAVAGFVADARGPAHQRR